MSFQNILKKAQKMALRIAPTGNEGQASGLLSLVIFVIVSVFVVVQIVAVIGDNLPSEVSNLLPIVYIGMGLIMLVAVLRAAGFF